ncbi:hypothetical protein [Thermomonospora umbrina]|uniref:DUF8094 domain-containing protein n=1 Tax=Thermomonospora umbrina TaxID=111806 RepID=A0A3D9SRB7_9ACTN|nr:hypothetical protein [Thermomonospora umbrina]REE98496.1 hypothetical protein DFJ69_3985 [Thermomonospora umbrina]
MCVRPAIGLLLLPPLLLSAACGGGSAEKSGDPALSKQQAASVLERYEQIKNEVHERAARALDGDLLATAETGPQYQMDVASYKLLRAAKEKFRPLQYGEPTFFIPRVTGYPRWFAAEATSRVVVRQGGKEKLARPVRHAMLFTQNGPQAPWLLAGDPLPAGESLVGKIDLDEEGLADAVPPTDGEKLVVSPAELRVAHAALLSKGPGAADQGAVLAGGPATDQAHAALQKATDQFQTLGITLTSRFVPHSAPVYALRTNDGGALVWYVLQQNETYTANAPGKLSVVGDLKGLIPAKAVRTRLDTTVLVQYLARIPATKGKATVTGTYRKAVEARAS